jgi:oxaloacetate decarboxylase alpha subunit
VRNVIDDERWSNVSDETVRYFLGHYGDPAAPVDPRVADRVLSRPRAEELRRLEPLNLDGARERFGAKISDEELLLRLTMPAEQVDAMLASPPSAAEPTRAPAPTLIPQPGRHPIVTLLDEVSRRKDIKSIRVRKGDELVVYRRAS